MAIVSFHPLSFWYIQFWLVCNSALVVVLRGLVVLLGCSSEQTHYLGWTGFIVRIWIYNSHLDLRLSPGFFIKHLICVVLNNFSDQIVYIMQTSAGSKQFKKRTALRLFPLLYLQNYIHVTFP